MSMSDAIGDVVVDIVVADALPTPSPPPSDPAPSPSPPVPSSLLSLTASAQLLYSDQQRERGETTDDGVSPYLLKRRKFYSAEQWQLLLAQLAATRTVYVGNLSFYTTEAQLVSSFAQVGRVVRLVMGLNERSMTPCGFCFVEFASHEEALNCQRHLSGLMADERTISADLDPVSTHRQTAAEEHSQQQQRQPPPLLLAQLTSHSGFLSHSPCVCGQGFEEGRQFGRSKLTGGQVSVVCWRCTALHRLRPSSPLSCTEPLVFVRDRSATIIARTLTPVEAATCCARRRRSHRSPPASSPSARRAAGRSKRSTSQPSEPADSNAPEEGTERSARERRKEHSQRWCRWHLQLQTLPKRGWAARGGGTETRTMRTRGSALRRRRRRRTRGTRPLMRLQTWRSAQAMGRTRWMRSSRPELRAMSSQRRTLTARGTAVAEGGWRQPTVSHSNRRVLHDHRSSLGVRRSCRIQCSIVTRSCRDCGVVV